MLRGPLIRIGAAAERLGVSHQTLRRWERAGKVACTRIGNQRYFFADELDGLLAEEARRAQMRCEERKRDSGLDEFFRRHRAGGDAGVPWEVTR